MKRCRIVLIATWTAVAAAACSKSETPPATPSPVAAAAPASESAVLKIPVLPGYKYYVGGPVMSQDAYGRFRISSFNGEVQQPPSRGMVFGAKVDGDQMEYRVWGNGTPLGFHKGKLRDGVYWEDYSEGFRMGKLVARERQVHDDAARTTKVITEDLDPENGEVIRTKEGTLPYAPPVIEDDDGFFDEEEEQELRQKTQGALVAPGASTAPAAVPKDAAK